MEKKLTSLFEFQKFAHDPRLDRMLEEAENRYGQALSDDDLELVSAAGTPEGFPSPRLEEDDRR